MTTQLLSTVLKNKKDVTAFTKAVGERTPEEVYECIGVILAQGVAKKSALKRIKDGRVGWEDVCFDEVRSRLHERDEFLVRPFEVEEGVLECPKCFGKKTFSYQKQSRGADEMTSTYAQCMKCMYKWVNSG